MADQARPVTSERLRGHLSPPQPVLAGATHPLAPANSGAFHSLAVLVQPSAATTSDTSAVASKYLIFLGSRSVQGDNNPSDVKTGLAHHEAESAEATPKRSRS